MVLAVVDDDTDVMHRIARDNAGIQRLAHAFLHCRDEHARNHAALHLVDELVACTARQRLDVDDRLSQVHPGPDRVCKGQQEAKSRVEGLFVTAEPFHDTLLGLANNRYRPHEHDDHEQYQDDDKEYDTD